MPTPKFLSLKNKKKNTIIESIGIILSKHSFDEINIVAIAKEAEISRGTFYNYFKDKDDAIRTYIEYYLTRFIDGFRTRFEKNDYNYMNTIRESFKVVVKVFVDELYKTIIKNTRYISYLTRVIDIENGMNEKVTELVEYLYKNIDKKYININNIEDMRLLVSITGNIFITSLMKLAIGANVDELEIQFEKKMDIIEKGIKR